MSGITPILDTLLHQVLGKRVDLPEPRDLNEPVKALQPGTALQAVRSDSRLEPRATTAAPVPDHSATGQSASQKLPPDSRSSAASSTATHLSTAARDIARLLMRFPEPPSVLRAPAPLLAPGQDMPPAAELATRMKASIDGSGLFYESHLRRWYQGTVTREQLEREPQMLLRAGAPTAVPATPPESLPVESRGESTGHGVSESLAGLVRHQLEMLATPVLRWEGDVWSGIFMALTIQWPQTRPQEWQTQSGHGGSTAAEDGEWHSELTLDVASIGEIRVSVRLFRQQLALTVVVPSPKVQAQFAARSASLETRLAAGGFEAVTLRVTVPGGGDD